MSKTFKIEKNPFDQDIQIYEKTKITVKPGITVLIGCNGSGKTTMLRIIEEQLKAENAAYIYFDNQKDGGSHAMDRYGFYNKMDELMAMFVSSEGERIMLVLQEYAASIGRLARMNRDKDLYILFDAVDSGFSIDNLQELKTDLFQVLMQDHPKDIYIICTANSYEMANQEDCIDVISCKHRKFKDYEEYRQAILESREKKDRRNK